MNKIFNITSIFKAKADEDGNIEIQGLASTPDIDRIGDIIDPKAWDKGGLKNFKANPIILFNHDHHSPIGKATNVEATSKGLELVAMISKAAHNNVAELIKDGILGAFSVSFMIKDADFKEETGGLLIKEAELLEVSVVSIPMNQAATFSLVKSFDSEKDYEEFKKTFTNRADLAGQSLAKEEANASKIASNAPGGDSKESHQEINMETNEIAAIAKKAAEEAAKTIALAAAKQKTAEEAIAKKAADEEAARKAEAEDAKKSVSIEVETATEALLKKFEERMAEKDVALQKTVDEFKSEFESQATELDKLRKSKMHFEDRGTGDMSKWSMELLQAHVLGVITGKGFDTDFGKEVMEKAGVDYTTSAADIDQTVATRIEKEIMQELKIATLFREIPVIAGATVLPMQPDSEAATFQATGATSGNLEEAGASDSAFDVQQVILNAYRLISSTFIDSDTDEQVLVALLPMLVDAVARAHARAVDNMIINDVGSISGLDTYASITASTLDLSDGTLLTGAILLGARQLMGKYGMVAKEVAYIVSQNGFYDLLDDSEFQDINLVGHDLASKVSGMVGTVFGSPVVVSDSFVAEATGTAAAFAVNIRNYVIPRLRGFKLETDYEVMAQRTVVVGSQSLGFEELTAGISGHDGVVKIDFVT